MTTLSQKLMDKHGIVPHPMSRVIKALYTAGVQMTPELARILALPRRPSTSNNAPDLSPVYVKADANRDGTKPCPGCHLCRSGKAALWPLQSWALWEADKANGLFVPAAVGAGKTLICLLLPDAMNAGRVVLLVKPNLKSQLINVDIPAYRRHFELPLKRIHVVSYNELSSAKKCDILEQVKPDLIVIDEAHSLRHRTSARTKRFLRYMADHPECRLAALSGTMTSRSILDYARIIELCLRKNSPLPARYGDLQDWAAAIDNGVERPMNPGKLMLFCAPGENHRTGFKRRQIETHGVIATQEGALGTSLVISTRKLVVPKVVIDALGHLGQYWEWDNEEIQDSMTFARVSRQIACGFFYRWAWPEGKKDVEWLAARADWHRELRDVLQHRSHAGFDSPLLVTRAIQDGRFSSDCWGAWDKVRNRSQPPVEVVWLSDFMVRDVLAWSEVAKREVAKRDGGGIVWTMHTAVGERLAGLGLPYYGADSGRGLDKVTPSLYPVIVCSIQACGEGRNLQAYSRNLITCPPADGKTWEQLLGRTHRPGQMADEVEVEVYLHTDKFVSAYKQALKDADFIEATQGQRQKLLYASRVG